MTVLIGGGAAAGSTVQAAGFLGLATVAEITDFYVFGTQDHTSYALHGMEAVLNGTYEYPHRLTVASGEIRFLYANTGTFNITVRCGVAETTNAATATEGYFAGKRSVVIEPGAFAVSDPIAVDRAAGQIIYERAHVTVAAAETWKIGTRNAQASRCDAGDDRTAGGALASGGIRGYGASAVLGPALGVTPVLAVGDSIVWGSGDALAATGLDWGFIGRALGPANIPVLNLGKPSETAQQIASDPAIRAPRWRFAGTGGKAVVMYGINDLVAGRTAAQVQADLLTVGTLLLRRDVSAYVCTITPKTTSTDSFATTVNQTVSTPPGATRATVNAWLRAAAPIDPTSKAAVAIGTPGALLAGGDGHPFTDVFDTATAVESAVDSGVWKASHTTDGLHPNATGHAALAAAINTSQLL